MTEMVERVARAICASAGYDPDGFDESTLPDNESKDGWSNWMGFQSETLAAILAMREPTMAQLAAGQAAWLKDDLKRSSTLYTAMIDAALSE